MYLNALCNTVQLSFCAQISGREHAHICGNIFVCYLNKAIYTKLSFVKICITSTIKIPLK